MNFQTILKYSLNCFLLFVPILLWNVFLAGSLPKGYQAAVFWRDIPSVVGTSENVLRIIIFVLPALMPLKLETQRQKTGLVLYLLGVILYFGSWLMQIYAPETAWSRSVYGFTAPAYTTLIWFVGVAMIGDTLFFTLRYKPIFYVCLSLAFVIVHTTHAYIVFSRF